MKKSNCFDDSIDELSLIKEKLKEYGLNVKDFIHEEVLVCDENVIINDKSGDKAILPLECLNSDIPSKRDITAMFYCFRDAQRGLYDGYNIDYYRSQFSYDYNFYSEDNSAVLRFQDDKVFVDYDLHNNKIVYCIYKANYKENGVVLESMTPIEFPISESQLKYKEEFLLAIMVNVIWKNL